MLCARPRTSQGCALPLPVVLHCVHLLMLRRSVLLHSVAQPSTADIISRGMAVNLSDRTYCATLVWC